MPRKLLVEMDPHEYSRFELFERLLKRLRAKNPQSTDEQVAEIVAGAISEILDPSAKIDKKPTSETRK